MMDKEVSTDKLFIPFFILFVNRFYAMFLQTHSQQPSHVTFINKSL